MYEFILKSLFKIILLSNVIHACDSNNFSSLIFMPIINLRDSVSLKIVFTTEALTKHLKQGKTKHINSIDLDT